MAVSYTHLDVYKRQRRGKTGYSYFIKGPEAEVAFAKLAGCSLAREVGLTVPEVAVCRFGTEKY